MLIDMGEASQVMSEVQRFRDRMQALPPAPGPDETVAPWNVRETLLAAGRDAATQLGRWDDALGLNAANVASKRDRRALPAEIARASFNDYGPLLASAAPTRRCTSCWTAARPFKTPATSATSARPSVPSPISRMHAATATPRFRCNATRCATPTSGTDLADLLHALSPDPDATDRALRDLIAQAQALAAAPPDDDQR